MSLIGVWNAAHPLDGIRRLSDAQQRSYNSTSATIATRPSTYATTGRSSNTGKSLGMRTSNERPAPLNAAGVGEGGLW